MPETPLSADSRSKVLALGAGFFFVFGFSNASIFLPVYYSQTGTLSARDAGMIVSAFYVAQIVSRPFLPDLMLRLGFRRLFGLAGLLAVAGSAGMVWAGDAFGLSCALRFVMGLAASAFQVGLGTFQALAFDERERGRAYSLIMSGGLIPMMTVVPLADGLLHRNLNGFYILLPFALCVGSAIVTRLIPGLDMECPVPTGSDGHRGTDRGGFVRNATACLRLHPFRLALLSLCLFSIADAAGSFMSSMTRSYGLMASFFLSSNALMGIGVRLLFGNVLDRFPRWLFSTPTIVLIAGALLLASVRPTELSLVAFGLLFGVGMGIGFPLHLALVSDGVPQDLQPYAVALAWLIEGTIFALVPFTMGWMEHAAGPVFAFRLLCALALSGSLVSGFLWWRGAVLGTRRRAEG